MALEDDIQILEQVTLLEGFSREQLRLLAFGAESMRIRAGRDLYNEGAIADCAYVVAKGTVELYREKSEKRVLVGRAGPTAILGELALISGGKRMTSASADATTDVDVIRLNRSLFRRILEEYPEVAATLHARIAGEMKTLIDDLGRLGPKFSS